MKPVDCMGYQKPSVYVFSSFVLVLLINILCYANGCQMILRNGHHQANCAGENYTKVPYRVYHGIRKLNLTNNKIRLLEAHAFWDYSQLMELYLENNVIDNISSNAFFGLSRLTVLDLSANKLTSVPMRALEWVKSLIVLNLRRNWISTIDKNAFAQLKHLRHLYLDGNYISHIDGNGFYGLQKLQVLYLQHNHLETLQPPVVQHFSNELLDVRLYNNPWVCNCSLRWLKDWLLNSTDSYSLTWSIKGLQPTCSLPKYLHKRRFEDVSRESFACLIVAHSSGIDKNDLQPGETVELYCKYFSDPPVETKWLKNDQLLQVHELFDKYHAEERGTLAMKESVLHIYDFQEEDGGTYKCLAENLRSTMVQKYTLTLEGVELVLPITKKEDTDHTQNAIIGASAVGGIIFLIVIITTIICLLRQLRDKEKKRKETIRMKLEDHLKANGLIEPAKNENHYDTMKVFRQNQEAQETDPLYDPNQTQLKMKTSSPANPNGSTYISFEPEDISHIYPGERKPDHHGLHAESTSPLLERYSPLTHDSCDLLYDTNLPPLHMSNSPRFTPVQLLDPTLRLTPASLTSSSPRLTPVIYDSHGPYDQHMDSGYGHEPRYSCDSDGRSHRTTPLYTDSLPTRPIPRAPYRLNHFPSNTIGYSRPNSSRSQNFPYNELTDDYPYSQPISRRYNPHSTLPYPIENGRLNSTGASSNSSRPSTPKSLSVGNLKSPPKKPPRSIYSKDSVDCVESVDFSPVDDLSQYEDITKYEFAIPKHAYSEDITTPV